MKSKIKSFEDACKALKIDSKKTPDVSMIPEKHQKSIIAYYKLIIIAEALNEGWVPDWENRAEYKYFPWLSFSSGSGFRYDVYVVWSTYAGVGSRLCFKSALLAEYAAKQFVEEYNDYIMLEK